MKKVLILLALLTSAIYGFDGRRQGFVLGFGAGYQLSNENMDYDFGIDIYNIKEDGLYTNFKIGYGFTDQFLLYYSRPANWGSYEDKYSKEVKITGLTGIGAAYYLKPQSPSPYIFANLGIADYFLNGWGASVDDAMQIGIGYEFMDRTSFEIAYYRADFRDPYIYGDVSSLSFSINYLFY